MYLWQSVTLSSCDLVGCNHNHAFNLASTTEKMIANIQSYRIATDGLFLNADAGFDMENFRVYYYQHEIVDNIDLNRRNGNMGEHLFYELMYKCRFVVERTNTWMNSFKAVMIRFKTMAMHWKALNLKAFCVILSHQLYSTSY